MHYKILQDPARNLSEVRSNFNAMLTQYPDMSSHISPDSVIVHSKHSESAIVKILNVELEFITYDFAHIPPSSNVVERLFSAARWVLTRRII